MIQAEIHIEIPYLENLFDREQLVGFDLHGFVVCVFLT